MADRGYPSFSDLPVDKNGPHGNAWGLWGQHDQLGTLNLLTDELVAQAAQENIKTGQRISLKYVCATLHLSPGYRRTPRHHDPSWSGIPLRRCPRITARD